MRFIDNPKNNDKLSALGFGFMRVGRDESKNEELLKFAVENGINYIDTAYIYPGNEDLLGRLLEKTGLRTSVKIATKLPTYLTKNTDDAKRIFAASMRRLRTDYIDYYLIHMLANVAELDRLKKIGVLDYLIELKKSGTIKNLGFSYHGNSNSFIELINAYDWDFCMIQYNYIDEHTQAGRKGLEHAAGKNIPVIIMEPLRGGMLADKNRLPGDVMKIINDFPEKREPVEWALRWLWNQPAVSMVLSGMKNINDMKSNIKICNSINPETINADETQAIEQITNIFRKQQYVPCTACGYCVPCPRGVDIPQCFDLYNQRAQKNHKSNIISKGLARTFYLMRTLGANAGKCSGCRACEPKCPQEIGIAAEMGRVRRKMEGLFYRPVSYIIKKFLKR